MAWPTLTWTTGEAVTVTGGKGGGDWYPVAGLVRSNMTTAEVVTGGDWSSETLTVIAVIPADCPAGTIQVNTPLLASMLAPAGGSPARL